MYIVMVYVNVKDGYFEEFEKATKENAENSLKEEGVIRFDVLREIENPNKYILFEVYKTEEDSKKHKQTQHYKKWRDTVEIMMAEERKSVKYKEIFLTEVLPKL